MMACGMMQEPDMGRDMGRDMSTQDMTTTTPTDMTNNDMPRDMLVFDQGTTQDMPVDQSTKTPPDDGQGAQLGGDVCATTPGRAPAQAKWLIWIVLGLALMRKRFTWGGRV